MIIDLCGRKVNLDDEVDTYFVHETLVYEKYIALRELEVSDLFTKNYKKDVLSTLYNKIRTGSWDYAAGTVYTYDEERFENVSDDFTMCWKKSTGHDKLIIHLTSFAGHEGRLTAPLTHVSDKVINLDTDLLVVNEDPLRYPETLYPSSMILGCSEKNDTQEKLCQQIRSYIKKDYKNVIIYADSKHAGPGLSLAYHLKDIVTNVIMTGGQSTYDWDNSPWIKSYFKWFNRPKHLENQRLDMINVAIMHMIKSWNFKKLNIDKKILDPYRFISEYPEIKVEYYYGKYDSDYIGFNNYVKKFKCDNLKVIEVDYKISNSQTHNIRPYVDRKILPDYIERI